MSHVVGYAIGEYVYENEDDEGDSDESEEESERDEEVKENEFYEIVTAWVNPK